MIVFVLYKGVDRFWEYHYFDVRKFKIKTSGFKSHINAMDHAKKALPNETIEFKFK